MKAYPKIPASSRALLSGSAAFFPSPPPDGSFGQVSSGKDDPRVLESMKGMSAKLAIPGRATPGAGRLQPESGSPERMPGPTRIKPVPAAILPADPLHLPRTARPPPAQAAKSGAIKAGGREGEPLEETERKQAPDQDPGKVQGEIEFFHFAFEGGEVFPS